MEASDETDVIQLLVLAWFFTSGILSRFTLFCFLFHTVNAILQPPPDLSAFSQNYVPGLESGQAEVKVNRFKQLGPLLKSHILRLILTTSRNTASIYRSRFEMLSSQAIEGTCTQVSINKAPLYTSAGPQHHPLTQSSNSYDVSGNS